MEILSAAAPATASGAGAGTGEGRPQLHPHARIDWRTGRPMLVRDAAFWQEHAARRIEQGLSIAAYCEANGLAKATFRRHASLGKTGSHKAAERSQPGGHQSSRFVAVHAPAVTTEAAMLVELETSEGLKLRVTGAAAERLVQHLLARLS